MCFQLPKAALLQRNGGAFRRRKHSGCNPVPKHSRFFSHLLDMKKSLLFLSLACGQDTSPLYKDKDVVFAYLCQASDFQDWRSMVAKDFAGAETNTNAVMQLIDGLG